MWCRHSDKSSVFFLRFSLKPFNREGAGEGARRGLGFDPPWDPLHSEAGDLIREPIPGTGTPGIEPGAAA